MRPSWIRRLQQHQEGTNQKERTADAKEKGTKKKQLATGKKKTKVVEQGPRKQENAVQEVKDKRDKDGMHRYVILIHTLFISMVIKQNSCNKYMNLLISYHKKEQVMQLIGICMMMSFDYKYQNTLRQATMYTSVFSIFSVVKHRS